VDNFQELLAATQRSDASSTHRFCGRGIIKQFEDIEGWQMARQLTKLIYKITKNNEFARDYGLKDQIQRASGSIMHNIAEGFDGGSNAEFVKFLRYSQRSSTEVQSELYVALDQQYISQEEFDEIYFLCGQTHSKIGGFIAYLLRSNRKK
jgi:four helix bundle protein